MKVQLIKASTKNLNTDATMKFLQGRHNSYVNRQLNKPIVMKNPIPQKTSMFKDFLALIGVLPIKRSSIK